MNKRDHAKNHPKLCYEDALLNTLALCQEQEEIIAIHRFSDDMEVFVAGYVGSFNQESLCLQMINAKGYSDGFQMIRIEDVERFHFDTDYLRRLKLLNKNLEKAYPAVATPCIRSSGVLWLSTLQAAMENNAVVTVQDIRRERFSGFVKMIGSDFVQIQILQEDGTKDGCYFIREKHILSVTVGSQTDQALQFVHDQRYAIYKL